MTHRRPESGPTAPTPDAQAAARHFACEAARLLDDSKCEQVRVLDLRGLSHVADYFVIATGTSDRQIRSVAEDLKDLSREEGEAILGREGDGDARWLVVDFVDVVVHLFEPETRAYYDLESLWGDAGEVAWHR